MEYDKKTLNGIEVFASRDLDGGGAAYGQDFVRFVREKLGFQRRIFEWCAGPGFIGFALLGAGLCETLCLADVNRKATEACRRTIEANGLGERVDVYCSDGLADLPASEKWSLVVGNPPHSGTERDLPGIDRPGIIYKDPGWDVHRRFYEEVPKFMEPGGHVVIQENLRFSCVETFREMIEDNGLTIVDVSSCGDTPRRHYYYIWSRLIEEPESLPYRF